MKDWQINILNLLQWDNSSDEIKQGFKEVLEHNEYEYLMLPDSHPKSRENCMIAIQMLSDDDIAPYYDKLLSWMGDLNREGAELILYRLQKVTKNEDFISHLENAILKANKQNDMDAIHNYSFLCDSYKEALLSKETKDILRKTGELSSDFFKL